jgi:heterodisulfide reductase subunit C
LEEVVTSQSGPDFEVDYDYLDEVQRGSGVDVAACYQCRKCSNGCPVAFAMDLRPEQVVKLVLLGDRERIESSRTIWICSSCQTCYTRCPNDVDIPRLMDWLKEGVEKKGVEAPEKSIQAFHQAFLNEVAKRGRVFEAGMMPSYLLNSGRINRDELEYNARFALTMFKRGRLALLPQSIKGKKEFRALFEE